MHMQDGTHFDAPIRFQTQFQEHDLTEMPINLAVSATDSALNFGRKFYLLAQAYYLYSRVLLSKTYLAIPLKWQ
jgi:hypothetical protein